MAFVTIDQALSAASREPQMRYESVQKILKDATHASVTRSFDIFLSHSKMDEKLILGAKRILEEKGFSVYVDWIDDPQLDRSKVNKATADYLRNRMKQCKLMFYVHTKNASLSRWCPWELGYFDANSRSTPRTYVFPLVRAGEGFEGQEYLELYPLVDIDNVGQLTSLKKDVWGKFPDSSATWRQMSTILEEVR